MLIFQGQQGRKVGRWIPFDLPAQGVARMSQDIIAAGNISEETIVVCESARDPEREIFTCGYIQCDFASRMVEATIFRLARDAQLVRRIGSRDQNGAPCGIASVKCSLRPFQNLMDPMSARSNNVPVLRGM